jgi:Na+-transporting methylmalonyl-CoA/oxaloacetate decarboxylase gamma subunit
MGTAASIALIILIIESMLFVSVFLVIMAAMVYAMVLLRRLVKRYMPKAQAYSYQVYVVTHRVSDEVAEPFLWAHATTAHLLTSARGFKRLLSRILG